MKKLASAIALAVDVALTYQAVRRGRKRTKLICGDLLLVIAALMVLAALGLGLAALYWLFIGLGAAAACALTAVAALAGGLAAFEISRRLLRSA